MIIGVLSLEFHLHGNDSLKGKRKVAQSLKQKLRNKFNVAVGEVEAQDDLDRLILAVVTVANETSKVESRLAKALAMVEEASPVELFRCSTEVFSSESSGGYPMKRSTSLRSTRMADLIQQELGRLLTEEVQDPRLNLVTISGVRLNTDLRIAEVLYTAHDPNAVKDAGKALAKAGGFLRSQLGRRLTLRYVPELRFVADDFLEDTIYARPAASDPEDS